LEGNTQETEIPNSSYKNYDLVRPKIIPMIGGIMNNTQQTTQQGVHLLELVSLKNFCTTAGVQVALYVFEIAGRCNEVLSLCIGSR
jgi:hypothetical protein